MIESYIENKQYRQALDLLTDLQDEQVRYYRLVCLYGLGELQQAKQEGLKAKMLASDTYYDVVALYVSILKELEEFEEAINIMVEELNMPYIPYEYETMFNAAYDELLLAKQEANQDGALYHTVFHKEDIENILQKNTNEDLLYMAIEQLESMNIRQFIPVIRMFLQDDKKPDYAKTLLMELMILQEIDEEMIVIKKGMEYEFNPSYFPCVLDQEASQAILTLLSNQIEDDNPSFYLLCEQFLGFYLYTIYPKYLDETKYPVIAGAIHYYLATLQYIDVEMEDIELWYHVEGNEVYQEIEQFQSIE